MLYTDSTCQTVLASDTPANFVGSGIKLTALRNATTTLYGATFDQVGNVSSCTYLTDYLHSDLGPSGLAATQNLDGTVSLSWNPDTVASPTASYIIKRALKTGGPYAVLAWSNRINSFVDTSISNGSNYYYVVQGTNNTGTSLISSEASVAVSVSLPDQVGVSPPLSATPGYQQIVLNWNSFATDYTYKVFRSTQTGGPYTLLSSGSASRTYIDLTATNGVAYYYVVRGTNPAGDSAQSTEASAVALDVPTAPANLIAVGVPSSPSCGGGGGVQLTWSAPSYFNTFFVKRGLNTGSESTIQTTSATTAIDCNPAGYPYTNYYVITGLWGSEATASSNEASFTNYSPPTLTLYPGNTNIVLTWSGVGNAQSYQVQRSLVAGGPYTTISSSVSGNSFTDSGLTNGTAYYYVVQANFSTGALTWISNEKSAIPGTAPSAPTHLTVVADAPSRLPRLSWSAPNKYDYFNVYTSTAPGGPFNQVAGGTLLPSATFLDTVSAPGLNYYYVTAAWGTTQTAASNIVSYRHGYPSTVTATGGASSIALSWTAVSGASGYDIYRSLQSGTGYSLLTSVATTTYTDAAVSASTGYFYQIQAKFSDATKGELSPEANATLNGNAIPRGLTVVATTGSSVTLAWAKVPGATSYRIYKSASLAGTYTLLTTASTPLAVTSGLLSGNTYYFKVTSVTGASESGFSSAVSAITNQTPNAPSGIAGNNKIDISWSLVSGATSYSLDRSTDGINFSNIVSGLTVSTYSDTGLTNGVMYFYIVTAVYSAGNYVSPSSNGITPGSVPGVPSVPQIVGNTSGTDVALSWGAVSGATGYNIYLSTTSGSYGSTPAAPNVSTIPTSIYSLTPGTTYYTVITSLIGTVESARSTEASFIAYATPNAPMTLVQSNTKINVTWSAISGATKYDVQRSADGYNFTNVATSLAGTSYLDSTPAAATSYVYRYLPYQGSLPLAFSTASAPPIATVTAPPAPTQLVGEVNASNKINLTWVPSSNTDNYNIFRGTSLGTYSYIGNVISPVTNYTDTTVSAGVTYYYVVSAVASSGAQSNQSNVAKVATSVAPTGLAAAVGGNAITLTWNLNGATSYTLRRGLTTGGPYAIIGSGLTTATYTDSTVDNAVTYYYVVDAVNASGAYSIDSTEASATAIVRMNLEVPIELIDQGLASDVTPITFARSTTSLNTSSYDGTITYSFEVTATNADSSSKSIKLINSSGTTVSSINVGSGTSSPTRLRATFTPTTGFDTYAIQLPATTSSFNLKVYSARLIVNQVGASKTKIYIPLSRSSGNPVNGDLSSPIETTTTTSYTTLQTGSLYGRNSLAYSHIADENAWELETLVSAFGGASGLVGLYNQNEAVPIGDSESEFNQSSVVMTRAAFSEGIAGYSTANDGETFQVSMLCFSNCSGGGVSLYKSGLWLSLTSLAKVEILYRTSPAYIASSPTYVDGERTLLNLSAFSNPSVSFQAVGLETANDTATISLNSVASNDSGLAGAAVISGSTLNFSAQNVTRLRSGSITPTTGLRYLPLVTPATSAFNLIDTSIVINANR